LQAVITPHQRDEPHSGGVNGFEASVSALKDEQFPERRELRHASRRHAAEELISRAFADARGIESKLGMRISRQLIGGLALNPARFPNAHR